MKRPSTGPTAAELRRENVALRTRLDKAKETLRSAKDDHESRVRDRTAELLEANRALHDEMDVHKRAEDQSLSERRRLYDVLDTLPAYVVLLSPDYHVPFANRFFRERFGEAHGRCCFEYLFGRTAPCENCESYKVLATGTRHHWWWTGPDARNYDIHDFPFTDADGSPLILEMGIDVTERVKAEAELDRYRRQLEQMVEVRTAALAASEQTVRHQNAILLGINRIFAAALTTETEEELGRVCLTVAEELTASRFAFVGEITPDGLHDIAVSDPGWDICRVSLGGDRHNLPVFKIHGIYGRVLTDGRSLIANDPASHPDRVGLPDGHPPLDSFLGVPLVRDARTIGMIAVANREGGYSRREQEALEALAPVIVEAFGRKRAEQALRGLNDMLEHRVRERTAEVRAQTNRLRALAVQLSQTQQRERTHLARILHDHVQQLLSAARMQLLWLRREPATEQVVNDALAVDAILKEAIDAARSLTVELSPPVLQEAGLVAGLRWLGGRMAERNSFQVDVRSDGRAEPESEEVRFILFECTRELLQNALKHSGVLKAEVTVARTPDDGITIMVEDKGKGFDLGEFRSRQLASEAFGLFNVQERLAHISGSLTIETAPGAGARIALTAPLGSETATAVDDAASNAARENGGARPARDAGLRTRILIVDDHQVMREGLGSMLRTERDFEVVGEAASALEAIELARALDPDVVIMDVNLGESSGIEATAAIRKNQPHIRVICLSMHDDPFLIDAMRDAGAATYLSKAGAAEALIDAIRACARPND
jgi:signal transduction histidine kinase